MLFACRGFPPFQLELLLAAAAAAWFHSQAALGVTAELCAPLPLPRGGGALVGGCWGPAELPLLCTRRGTGENTWPCPSHAVR